MADARPADDDNEATQVDELIQPDSIVASGTQCSVTFSIDHKTGVASVGPATLVPIATATVTAGTVNVVSATISEYVSVTPAPPAINQTPVSNSVSVTQLLNSFGTPVTVQVKWDDQVQFQNADLCSAMASTTITVHFSSGSPCTIAKTTQFPTCVPVH